MCTLVGWGKKHASLRVETLPDLRVTRYAVWSVAHVMTPTNKKLEGAGCRVHLSDLCAALLVRGVLRVGFTLSLGRIWFRCVFADVFT